MPTMLKREPEGYFSGGKMGCIDTSGRWRIESVWDVVSPIKAGRAPVLVGPAFRRRIDQEARHQLKIPEARDAMRGP